jgi:hypothetical protein
LGPIDGPEWININAIRNFQGQFSLPPNLVTIYNKFNRNYGGKFPGDNSRKVVYQLIEYFMESGNGNARDCLKRTICEVAESPVNHNGLFGEILQLIFSPNDSENIDDDFKDARKAGEHGVDCLKIYPDCPLGDGFLDGIASFQEFQ